MNFGTKAYEIVRGITIPRTDAIMPRVRAICQEYNRQTGLRLEIVMAIAVLDRIEEEARERVPDTEETRR